MDEETKILNEKMQKNKFGYFHFILKDDSKFSKNEVLGEYKILLQDIIDKNNSNIKEKWVKMKNSKNQFGAHMKITIYIDYNA